MDNFDDDSKGDELLEDYLFSGYKPQSDATFDEDQQFAAPIEDEDFLGVGNSQPPSTAQTKMRAMKEKVLAQAKAMKLKPKKLGTGFGEDDTIEVILKQNQLVSDTSSKRIFDRMLKNKSNKDKNTSPECVKTSWDDHKQSLRKSICAQKRKIWDSIQKPSDEYDEEEEFIGESTAEDCDEGLNEESGKESDEELEEELDKKLDEESDEELDEESE